MTTRTRARPVDPLADIALAAHDVSEKQFSAIVRDLAGKASFSMTYHTFRSTFSPSGFPDEVLVSVAKRRVLFAELKRDRKSPVSEEQIDWLEGIRAAGGEAYLWYGDDPLQVVADILTGPRPTSWPVSVREQIAAKGGSIKPRKIRGEARYRGVA